MSYLILGRAIKNEYLALGTFGAAFGTAFLATRGGDKKAPTNAQEAKAAVPINASSKDEEDFINSFIAAAEKEGAAKH